MTTRVQAPVRVPIGATGLGSRTPPTRARAVAAARARATPSAEPLLRNGHVLTLSSLLSAALGAGFWVIATSWYSTATVGRSYASLSAVMLLAGIGQLNLADVLVRFVPAAGRHTRRLLLRCYGASALCSMAAAAVFLALVPTLAPGLAHLRSPLSACYFVAATVGYAIFVLQDGVLTGLRRPGWVLTENALFALVKTVLLVICGFWALRTGILLSWVGALVAALLVTNLFLFRRAVPAHQRAAQLPAPPPRLLGYASADYVGAMFRLAAYSVTPLLVLNALGSEASAYFSLTWVIAYTLFQAAYNMGSSLIVEAARDPDRLAEHGRRVLRHSGLLLSAGVAVLLVAAPWLLALFGHAYVEHSTTLLRLLALASLPNLLVGVAVDVARARRRLGWAVGLQAALCVMVLGFSTWLLPVLGITGVGVAWLLAECVLGLPLLIALPRWLPAPGRTRHHEPPREAREGRTP